MRLDGSMPVSAVCHRGRHTLDLPGLRLQTPTFRDLMMMDAAASDPAAQRWFGWPPEQVLTEPYRDRLLTERPGQGRPMRRPVGTGMGMVAIDRAGGGFAGGIVVQLGSGELGGWLAPEFRSRGLGGQLFLGGAFFGHHVLGTGVVRAGTETANAACLGALRSAGFVPDDGTAVHHLPDGRAVPTQWFGHRAEPAARCRAAR
jgi:RimJ/RimL family protein N-acetyltransferase